MGGLKIDQMKKKKNNGIRKAVISLLNTVDIGPQSSKFRHLQVVHVAEDKENQKRQKSSSTGSHPIIGITVSPLGVGIVQPSTRTFKDNPTSSSHL